MRLGSRLRRATWEVRRLFPWTLRGVGVSALSAAALWIWGFGEIDLLLLAVGASGLAIVAVASGMVAVGAAGLRWKLRQTVPEPAHHRRVETGAWWRTGLQIPDWHVVPWIQVEVCWERPSGADARLIPMDGALIEEVRPQRRWLEPEATRVWTVRDAFGLAAVSVRDTRPLPSWVLPAVGRLREAPIVTALTGADGIPWPSGAPEGDRMEIRRYAPGDSARDVMWNVYAKTRRLHVRLRERAVDPSRRLVGYLVAGARDEASAAAARVALETGALGDEWTFGADGTPGGHTELASALEAVARSGGFESECGLEMFLEEVEVGDDAACVVFVPPRCGAWTVAVARAMARRPGRVCIVVGVDRLQQSRPSRAAWRRFAFEVSAVEGEPVDEVFEVARSLAVDAAAPPLLVSRASGRSQLLGARELAEEAA